MTTDTQSLKSAAEVAQQEKKASSQSTFGRVVKYTFVRTVVLFITVVIGIYLTILIANMGGYVDDIMRSQIQERITMVVTMDPANQTMAPEARNKLILDRIALEEKRLGLDKPFVIRSFRFLENAIFLNLGRAQNMSSDSGSKQVRLIILERLPTLLLMGTSQLVLFFASIYFAMILSRKYGSFWDRVIIALSPTSSAPSWFYGIFFILLFAAVLKWLPFGGMVGAPPPSNKIDYMLDVLSVTGASTVQGTLRDSNSSCLITYPDHPDCKYVIMPMRL